MKKWYFAPTRRLLHTRIFTYFPNDSQENLNNYDKPKQFWTTKKHTKAQNNSCLKKKDFQGGFYILI